VLRQRLALHQRPEDRQRVAVADQQQRLPAVRRLKALQEWREPLGNVPNALAAACAQFAPFGMWNRALGPYLATKNRSLIPIMHPDRGHAEQGLWTLFDDQYQDAQFSNDRTGAKHAEPISLKSGHKRPRGVHHTTLGML
jgi:hypothetical protein